MVLGESFMGEAVVGGSMRADSYRVVGGVGGSMRGL